jgi:hydrogenase nickel incorporation protein HypA/HybF
VHELAISQSVVDAVLARTGDARVTVVRLDVGRLSGVVPDALRFCFDLVADGTPLAGAELRIAEPPGRARCATCGADFGLDQPILLCPCGSADVQVTAGRDLLVRSVEVA